MPYTTSEKTNIFQNSLEYKLPLSKSNLFRKGYFEKILNPPQEDSTKPRTVTITCKYPSCR